LRAAELRVVCHTKLTYFAIYLADNPKIEAHNGWIKEKLHLAFHLTQLNNIRRILKEYVKYFNHERPSYALIFFVFFSICF
jgi:hypothetical protein